MYVTEDLLKRALGIVDKKKPKSITELIAWMGISRDTFYIHFPTGSDNYKEILENICNEKAKIKAGMLQKWVLGDSAVLQIAGYKLLADPEELRALSMQTQDIELPDNLDIEISIKR
jgi:ACT domain-containing protein